MRSHRHRQGGQAGRVADGKGDVGARDAGARHKPASGHAQEPTRMSRSSAALARRPAIEIADGLQGQGEVGVEERAAR